MATMKKSVVSFAQSCTERGGIKHVIISRATLLWTLVATEEIVAGRCISVVFLRIHWDVKENACSGGGYEIITSKEG